MALGKFVRQTRPDSPAGNPDSSSNLPERQWLELLAAVLGSSPEWLLESGHVDADDLAERGRISAAARLIRSHGWGSAAQQAVAPENTSERTPSPAWLAARDAYVHHVMGCRLCRAHLLKDPAHCPAGAELREHYDQQSTLTTTKENTRG